MLKIGHRGAKGHIAENTLASFEKALSLGVDAIEFDVHLCRSGELVVIHDFTADRTTNGQGEISLMSLSQLKNLKVEKQHQIPTIKEVLNLVDKRCLINIEMKGSSTARAVSEIIDIYVTNHGYNYTDFIVSSFLYPELETLHKTNKSIPLAILTRNSIEQALEWAKQFSAKAIHPHFSLLNAENVKKIQDKGYKVYTWTVNDPADIQQVKQYKVNGIISDYPERI